MSDRTTLFQIFLGLLIWPGPLTSPNNIGIASTFAGQSADHDDSPSTSKAAETSSEPASPHDMEATNTVSSKKQSRPKPIAASKSINSQAPAKVASPRSPRSPRQPASPGERKTRAGTFQHVAPAWFRLSSVSSGNGQRNQAQAKMSCH